MNDVPEYPYEIVATDHRPLRNLYYDLFPEISPKIPQVAESVTLNDTILPKKGKMTCPVGCTVFFRSCTAS